MIPRNHAPGPAATDPSAKHCGENGNHNTLAGFSEFQGATLRFLAGNWRTCWDAASALNTCALRSVISGLKKRGVRIEVKRGKFVGRHGRMVSHCYYRLPDGELERLMERQRHAPAERQ